MCGEYSSDWDNFYRAARYIHDLNLIKDPPLTLRRIITISDRRGYLWHKERAHYESLIERMMNYLSDDIIHIEHLRRADQIETARLCYLLEQFSDSKAADPRDRVFALLSLMDVQEPNQLPTDYALTEGEVYYNAMSYVLSRERASDLLGYFAPPTLSHVRGTPSWVPNFSCPRVWKDVSTEYFEPLINDRFFNYETPTISGEILMISGAVYEKIEACTIYTSPAEAHHFPQEDCITEKTRELHPPKPDIKPDMNDFILVIQDIFDHVYASKVSQREELVPELGRECISSRLPLEEEFFGVLKSSHGLTALQTNEMPHKDPPTTLANPLELARQKYIELFDVQTEFSTLELENWVRIAISDRAKPQISECDINTKDDPNTDPTAFRDALYRYRRPKRNQDSKLYVHKHGRQLFMVRDNFVGVGPPGLGSVRAGDFVVQLDSGRRLHALRLQPDGSYTYRGAVTLEKAWYDHSKWQQYRRLERDERRFHIR